MSPFAERSWHLLAEDLPGRDGESAAEITGSSTEAAMARRPGTTRIKRDIQEQRRPRQIMGLSIAVLKREEHSEQVRRGQPSKCGHSRDGGRAGIRVPRFGFDDATARRAARRSER